MDEIKIFLKILTAFYVRGKTKSNLVVQFGRDTKSLSFRCDLMKSLALACQNVVVQNSTTPCLYEFINNPGKPVAAPVRHTADGAGARSAMLARYTENHFPRSFHIIFPRKWL